MTLAMRAMLLVQRSVTSTDVHGPITTEVNTKMPANADGVMTEEQKKFCLQTAQWMDRTKTFPGGVKFLADLFQEIISSNGLTVIDQSDPTISLRREITQELYDALWMARELRKSGYTMQTARRLGLGDLYAQHGSQGLARWMELATDNALHNAALEGFSRSENARVVNDSIATGETNASNY